jgi:pimeloyl-ACP methyl ester carboxylesterase
MNEHVDDLEEVLQSFSDPSIHLVGHSYGAFVCLLLAIRKPSIVKKLVLAEPPIVSLFVSNTPKLSEIVRTFFTRPQTAIAIIKFGVLGVAPAVTALRRNDIETAIKAFGKATLGSKAFRQLSEERKKQVQDNFIKAELLGSGFVSVDKQQIHNIEIPTLLLTAQNSPRLFHHLSRRLCELLPNVESAVIPSASHIMHEDNPKEYNSIVRSFFSK